MSLSRVINKISEIEKRYPAFNHRSLGINDFYEICNEENIVVAEWDLGRKIKGVYLVIDGTHHIILEKYLRLEKKVVAFAELGHYFLHRDYNHFFITKNTLLIGSIEWQSQIFSAFAILPTLILDQYREQEEDNPTISNISRIYGIPESLVEFRLNLYKNKSI